MKQNRLIVAMTAMVGVLLTHVPSVQGIILPPTGTNSEPTYTILDSWSFEDHTNWTSDYGYAPVSFTNLNFSQLGDGASLVVDTNEPAWLQYNVYNSDGTTNLTVDQGTVMFWFAPSSWSSTNVGGVGPGEYGRLLEIGGYTTNSSYGLWSIYVDDAGQNIYFSAQTNDLSGDLTTYLTAPISWTTNYFHFVVLTYSLTNTALYLDGVLATNGPGVTVYPGANVLAGGFYLGSDSNGVYQAQGLFNTVGTYAEPLDADTIAAVFANEYNYYVLNPLNITMWTSLGSAETTNTTFTALDNVISGPGNLLWVTNASNCVDGTNAYNVWVTNVVARVTANGTINLEFTIEGGAAGIPFDVFANSVLSFGSNGIPWAWEGQGYQCNTYLLTNLPDTTCYVILGTPQDSTGDGLTDAYKLLVAKANPSAYSTDGTGMADGWEVLYFGHIGVASNGDPDGDGLTTFQEWQMHSANYNPTKWNTFTNGVGDGYQNYNGDGLANLMQVSFGGNMLTNNTAWKANAAGDGFPDEYKAMVGLSTSTAVPVPGLPPYSLTPIQ
jgi:hypothetical protein